MSKKKKRRNNLPKQDSQKPETAKSPEEKTENYITIEIPDRPEEEPQAAQPKVNPEEPVEKSEENSEEKPEEKPEDKSEETAAEKDTAPSKSNKSKPRKGKKASVSAEKSATPPKPKPEESENPENEITIELPDSEAEKIKTFTPQVTAVEKPPLTPEQIEAKKHRNRTIIKKTADVVFTVIITLMGLLMLVPIFFSIVQSFKSTAELGNVPQTFFPKDFTFKSFVSLFTSTGKMGVPFYRFIFNTLFVSAAVTLLRVLVTMPAAYVLAKVKAPMIKTLNRIVEWSLALTPALAFTLNNALMSKTWFADTYFAVILPFITSPLCLVLMREAIRHIPDDTIAAAQMEGCSHITILRKFVTPQIRPIIAAVAVLSLFEIGKISGGPLTFGETMDMLPAFMEQLHERGAAGEMYALALLMFIPVVVLLVVFRKSILKTMTTAMLKDEV